MKSNKYIQLIRLFWAYLQLDTIRFVKRNFKSCVAFIKNPINEFHIRREVSRYEKQMESMFSEVERNTDNMLKMADYMAEDIKAGKEPVNEEIIAKIKGANNG